MVTIGDLLLISYAALKTMSELCHQMLTPDHRASVERLIELQGIPREIEMGKAL